MAVKEDEKYFPYRISWLILNKLSEFNDKPQLIEDLAEKFEKLTSLINFTFTFASVIIIIIIFLFRYFLKYFTIKHVFLKKFKL